MADRSGLAGSWPHLKNVFTEKIIYLKIKGGFIMKKELKDTAFVGGLLIDGTGAEPIKDSLVLVKTEKSPMRVLEKNLVRSMKS